jgi:hypothetical protein
MYSMCRFIQHLWNQKVLKTNFMVIRTLQVICISVSLATSRSHLFSLSLDILSRFLHHFLSPFHYCSCNMVYICARAHTHTTIYIHFAVAIWTVHIHKFTLQTVFLDQLFLYKLSKLVWGAASWWNNEIQWVPVNLQLKKLFTSALTVFEAVTSGTTKLVCCKRDIFIFLHLLFSSSFYLLYPIMLQNNFLWWSTPYFFRSKLISPPVIKLLYTWQVNGWIKCWCSVQISTSSAGLYFKI